MGADRNATANARHFRVPPPGKATWILMLLLALLLPAGGIGLAIWQDPPNGTGEALGLWGVLAFMLLLGGGLTLLLQRRSVQLLGGTLVVKATLYTRRIPVAQLELEDARVVDLREHTELKPLLKTNGYALPGFHAGHFRLRDRSKAFMLVSDRSRVLVLPVAGEAMLMISPERPAALLDALRAVQARQRA